MKSINLGILLLISIGVLFNASLVNADQANTNAAVDCSNIQNVKQVRQEVHDLRTQIRSTKVKEGVLIGVGVTAEAVAVLFTGGAGFVFQAGLVGTVGAASGATGTVMVYSGAALASGVGGIVAFFKAHNPITQRRELYVKLTQIEGELSACN